MGARSAGCAVVLLFAAGLLVLAMSLESSFLYFPVKPYAAKPRDFGLRAEDVTATSEDGVPLRGWWVRGDGSRVLLFFHGNAGNVSHRLERTKQIVDALAIDVLLLDYRGYGASEGRPSEAGLYADGEAIYRAAASRGFSPDRIVFFGESLGCAVALETALHHPGRAAILETPFLSVPAMAKALYPWVPRLVIRSRFDNESKITHLSIPKLIVAAERDEIVPPGHARRLYELAAPPKEFLSIPGASHNDVGMVGGRAYLEEWRRFLNR